MQGVRRDAVRALLATDNAAVRPVRPAKLPNLLLRGPLVGVTMQTSHIRFLDLVKALACNLIVLHHLAFYGPMADHVRPFMPGTIDSLADQARYAVQAFLVMGGFLAAKSLSQGPSALAQPARAVWRRFAKLVPPFIVAIVLAVLASALAALWMTHDSISAAPTLGQLAAHALLLHGVLGYESLSAGAWYVAIDFQLYALLTLLLWAARRGRIGVWFAPLVIATGAAASLLIFNRDAGWDAWAPYFFGSYGLGALAWWAADRSRGQAIAAVLTLTILVLGGAALAIDFRSRIAVALVTAIALVLVCRGILQVPGQQSRIAGFLGRISYAVFLVHFPVILVVNAAFTRFMPALPEVQGIGVVLAWSASIAAGAVFHRWIEVPLGRLMNISRVGRKAPDLRPQV
jgi:peptidoglycan/LPS O-acetylase OafA/YrhL